MKKVLILFAVLLVSFAGTWAVKANMPINRPENDEIELTDAWYNQAYTSPTAETEWTLDPEIPLNYIPVPGQAGLFMVVDDSGKIIKYMQRTVLGDGTSNWKEVNPDIPEDYERVEGLDNVYRTTAEDGTVQYFKYVRNEDDTFAFIAVDEKGVPLNDGADATTITGEYVHADNNTYAKYNEHGVLEGYYNRVKNADGNYVWKATDPPAAVTQVGNATGIITPSTNGGTGGSSGGSYRPESGDPALTQRHENADGSYTVEETVMNTETKDGYMTTYKTIVTRSYDAAGNLISSRKDGPYQVSQTAVSSPESAQTASTLDAEYSRVTAQATINYGKSSELLAALNAQRTADGLPALSSSEGGDLYKIAALRACDMAIYDHGSNISPVYGSIDDLLAKYGVAGPVGENVWKTSEKSADSINTRFQASSDTRGLRESSGYSEAAVVIVTRNGQDYIVELYR